MWIECKRRHPNKYPEYVMINTDCIVAFEPDSIDGEPVTRIFLKGGVEFTCNVTYMEFMRYVKDTNCSLCRNI